MTNPPSAAVDVVLPLPIDQPFSYRVPDELAGDAREGCRVLVPFGPRRLTGLVVAVREDGGEEAGKLKPVLDVLDDEPSFTPEMLRLTKWMADYYVCGWGEVAKAALPTGTDVGTEHRLVRTGAPAAGAAHPKARAVLRFMEAHPEASVSALRQQVKDVPMALLRRLERDGLLRIEEEVSQPKVSVRFEKHLRFAPAFRHAGAAA